MKPRIILYFHCKKCMSGQLASGWTKHGLQIYCENCKHNVIDLDFKGRKVDLYKK